MSVLKEGEKRFSGEVCGWRCVYLVDTFLFCIDSMYFVDRDSIEH